MPPLRKTGPCAGVVPALLAAALLAVPAVRADAPSYSLRPLTVPGGYALTPTGVNDTGQVTGSYSLLGSPATHAFLTDPNGGTLRDLGTLGGRDSSASGVNGAGQVAGSSLLADGSTTHAFLSGPNGGALRDLGTLPGYDASYGTAVNNGGQVAGYFYNTGAHITNAFL